MPPDLRPGTGLVPGCAGSCRGVPGHASPHGARKRRTASRGLLRAARALACGFRVFHVIYCGHGEA
jgi:hypothetical protein